MRQINNKGLELIKDSEGTRLVAYKDAVGKPTIGVGHLILPEDNLKVGDSITQEQANELLRFDLIRTEDGVEELLKVEVNDNQFAALVSFAFNLGIGNLKNSTLLRKVNVGDFEGAAEEFKRWSKAGGRTLQGLVTRREKEKELFLSE